MVKKLLGIIPARFASTRFPGKPLVDLAGKSMIRRVYENSLRCTYLDDLIVATDDQRIYQEVQSFGGKCMLTSSEHLSGTSRVAEVAKMSTGFAYFLNIQGDQPLISTDTLDVIAQQTKELGIDPGITTLATSIKINQADNPNLVKVLCNRQGQAMYFSRARIPYVRDLGEKINFNYLKHIGIYGFTKAALEQIQSMKSSYLENIERLEQLTWLYEGLTIKVHLVRESNTLSIDSRDDVVSVLKQL